MANSCFMPEFIRLLNNHRKFGKMMFDRAVTENDALRPQQVFLLDDLREVGKSKLKDIAAKTGHSPQNLCMLYAKLEKAGLIGREIDPENRRNTYYFVTPAGEKAIDAHKSRGESVMRDLLSVLSDADLEKLAQSLKNVNDVLEPVVKE